MRFSFFIISCLFLWAPIFVFAAQSGNIMFSEIAYDLTGADDGHEWVELHNISSSDIDITGWKFNDGANHVLNVPPKNGGQGAMVISAGGYAVLATDAAQFLSDHPGFSGTVIDTVISMNNTGATLTLFDANGVSIDAVSYTKDWGAAGNGMTLECKAGGVWKESSREGGTPGAVNSDDADSYQPSEAATTTPSVLETPSIPAALQIIPDAGENIVALAGEEIMFDASGTTGAGGASFVWNFGDGTVAQGETIFHRYLFPGKYIVVLSVAGAEDTIEANIYPRGIAISEFMPEAGAGENEWVEVQNDSPYSVDLSGWGIGISEKKAGFVIPQGTTLVAGGYLVFSKEVSRIALQNETGMIVLWYPHGQQAMRVDYDRAKKGFSAARKHDGSYAWTDQRTPGARNVFVVSDNGAQQDPQASAVEEMHADAPAMRAAWQRVRDDAGGAVKSFIAPSAHAMVYDEGASSVFVLSAVVPAAAYGAFPFGIAALLGVAGGIAGTFLMRRRVK